MKRKENENPQRNSFQLTINNPLPDYSHEKIKGILHTQFKTLKFYCMADEVGEQGTEHMHIYIIFSSRVRWNTVKKHFPTAHIEIAHATATKNVEYIKKIGKWEETEKSSTRVEGTYEEWGTIPTQKGTIPAMEELFEMIQAGFSNSQILAHNNDYIMNVDKLDRVRTMLLMDENKNNRRTDIKVIYVSGATGTGKTRMVLDKHGDSQVYRVTDYQHPFDGYECQNVMVFEEFRSGFRISDVLNYMDIYPIQLPARYSNKFACYHYLYFISNLTLEEQYQDVQRESKESWNSFLRRIHEVQVFQQDGKIDIYDSVKAYMERRRDFQPIGNTEIASVEEIFKEEAEYGSKD